MKRLEEEAQIAYATFLEIEGKTEEAIATLESINNISSSWLLAQVSICCAAKLSVFTLSLTLTLFSVDLSAAVRGGQ